MGSPLYAIVVLPGDTHGSAHFNPRYIEALVEFVSAHESGSTP